MHGYEVMKPRHLYAHAAFCARRCSYCDFAVHVDSDPPVEAWATALGRELGRVADEGGWSTLELQTLYLGGGTPSLLGVGAVPRLLEALAPRVDRTGLCEFTAEANPESFTRELARDWRAAGVDRLSFGAQTFHVPSLRWMGRLHGPDGPVRALRTARSAGFERIGLDLIFGLPSRLGRDLADDIDRMVALEPEHISVYGLTAERRTPLGRWVASGRERMPDEDRYAEEYLLVSDRLRAAGYTHYEVSNFARPGHEAIHNRAYWDGVPYVGLGNGAHSYVPPVRWWNHRDWREYREALARGASARAGHEDVDPSTAALERLWLDLRTRTGVAASDLSARQVELAREWRTRGWAEPDTARLRLTPAGWLVLDRLAVELDGAGARVA